MKLKPWSSAFILLAALAAGACSNPDPDPGPGNPDNPGATACANAGCDANATCDASSGQAVCTCRAGYSGDGKTCADVDECATAGSCSANATCTNTPGSHTCACRPGYSGDGRTCTATSSTGRVLVFADGAGTPPAAAAATSLGVTVTVTTTEANFVGAFDQGGFEVVVVESATVPFPANVQSRLTSWINGTGKAIIAHAALNQLPALQDLLAVDAASPATSWRNLYVAANVAPNLFEQLLSLPNPLVATASSPGLELTPRATGVKLAAFGSATGAGAMAVTHGQRVLVHGFRSADVALVDKEGDGVPDIQELYANELLYLLNPRVLVYDDNPEGPQLAAKAVNQLKMTALVTSNATQFQPTSARGGYQMLFVDCTSDTLPDEVKDKVTSWVSAKSPLLFSYWDLDQEETFAFDLGVTLVSFNYSRSIYHAPTSTQNFFSLRETLPSPISGVDLNFDKGDELTLSRPGFIAARFDSATGPGAIAVTHEGKVIINGFISYEMEPDDEDGDGKPDVQELFVNQLVFLGAP